MTGVTAPVVLQSTAPGVMPKAVVAANSAGFRLPVTVPTTSLKLVNSGNAANSSLVKSEN